MTAIEIITIIKSKENLTYNQLAERLGEDANVVRSRLTMSQNLGTKSLVDMVNAMGYKIVVMPNNYKIQDGDMYIVNNEKDLPKVDKKCPHCKHSLTNSEMRYIGCPYCLKPFDAETKALWLASTKRREEIQSIRKELITDTDNETLLEGANDER